MLVNDTGIEFLTNEVLFAKINAEVDTAIANKYYARAFPTFLVVNPQGEEIDRIVGYAPTAEFIQMVKDYINGIGTLDDLLAKADTEKDRDMYFEIADKYKYRGGLEDAKTWYQKVLDAGEPTDSLSGESRMALADMFRRDEAYDNAIEAYQAVAKDFKGTMFEEGADIYIAYTTMKKEDTVNAIKAFETFVKKYPESEDKEWAESQIKKLNGEVEEEKE